MTRGSGDRAPDGFEERLRRLREEHPPALMPMPPPEAPRPPRPRVEVDDDRLDGETG